MTRASSIAILEKLRKLRATPPVDISIAGEVGKAVRLIKRAEKTSGALDAAQQHFGTVAPRGLRECCQIVELSRGVLTVRCENGAAAYQLDHWLKTGGMRLLQGKGTQAGAHGGAAGVPIASSAKLPNIARVRIKQ